MTYGFIGTGNMGGALARALVRTVSSSNVYLNNRTPAKAEALAAELGARADTAAHIAAACDYIFLGVKPNLIAGVLAQLAPTLAQRTDKPVLVSMAAGVTIAALEQAAPGCPILRIMPNTACAVGAGLTLYDANALLTNPQLDAFLADMAASGRLEALPEHLIDAGSAVAGCGGAFACLFMEGLADGAVTCGLPRDKANTFAAQMLPGAARLALESRKGSGYVAQLWAMRSAYPAQKLTDAARRFDRNWCRMAVTEAAKADLAMKSVSGADGEELLIGLLLKLANTKPKTGIA